MHLKLWTELTVWHFISLMLNFHYLWSGNPAENQSHLIIYCQDVSYWPSFSLSKHCKTLSQRHTSIQMHTHTHPAISLQSTVTNLLCIPAKKRSAPGDTNFEKAKGPASFLKGLVSLLFPPPCWAIWGYWFVSAEVWWDEMRTRRTNLVY